MKKKITFISDTHSKHNHLTSVGMGNPLGDGDILVHAGDLSSLGHKHEIINFLDWFAKTPFEHKIFVAGNHDFYFEKNFQIDEKYAEMGIHYLFDDHISIDGITFYGSPWQPEFYDWAFNLPKNGYELKQRWDMIPQNVDVLITHGPAFGILDYAPMGGHVGCELLLDKIMEVKPKIHVCGHIHEGYGQKTIDGIEFLNSSVLNGQYQHKNKPIKMIFDTETKEFEYV
jgi:Icc-related predicted phosphoesterase